MLNRLDTIFGNDALHEPRTLRLKPFGARYRFAGRTFGLVVYALDFADAADYATAHGLIIDGEIVFHCEN